MDRRAYVAACGMVSLGGCLGVVDDRDEGLRPGDISCVEDLSSGSSNGPDDGSWPTELHDMQNTGQTDVPGPSGCVKTRWTLPQNPQGGLHTGPVVSDGLVYVPDQTNADTWFVALDAQTGEEQWQYTDTSHERLVPRHSPTLSDDRLYLVDGDNLACVDTQNQVTGWFLDLSDEQEKLPGIGIPRVVEGTVYIGVGTGEVLALNANTGARQWTHDIEGLPSTQSIEGDNDSQVKARRRGTPYAPVAATEQRVYVTSWDLSLHALNAATGEREWQFSPGMDHLDMMHAPAVVDGVVYTQTEDAILYVLDAETGELLWTYDEYGESSDGVSPVVDDESVYIIAGTSTENLFLIALNRADGTVRWKRSVGPPFVEPAADADTLYIDQGRSLQAIEKATGDRLWTLHTDRAVSAPPAIVNEAVYVADDSHFYGLW
ncbi:PQQ-binding-like beta-propeller repeat protein [Haloarcula sp. JP-L23]|uniref:outer membrane protein assembly factor BamB family protein n=1 Tax=Haloarcula sp. JP-L23 TaxID=2716717 RepID=UPI00140EEDA7|nr:PQQ-like beta-propeller repeat protein [Haloarcula sp. JP-L23]